MKAFGNTARDTAGATINLHRYEWIVTHDDTTISVYTRTDAPLEARQAAERELGYTFTGGGGTFLHLVRRPSAPPIQPSLFEAFDLRCV